MSNSADPLKSVERAFRILEFVRDNEPVSLTQVAEALDMSKSTIHRHLSTLVSVGYLGQEDGRYRVSFEFLSYANRIHLREPSYPTIKRKVRELADTSEELVQFTTDEEGRLVYLFKETGPNGLVSRPDARTFRPLHSTAGGKSILSTWSDAEVEAYVDRNGLDAVTEHTITDPDVLFEELERVRERGYATNREETVEGLGAVAVPIADQANGVVGALGISGPINRVGEGEYSELLRDAKKELELNIRLL
jgi:DNA-binding IclR family transcriptional regulator